jgi:hypothetical protein
MVSALAAVTTVTAVARATVKTMAATMIVGGTNNNQLKAAVEETVAGQQRW